MSGLDFISLFREFGATGISVAVCLYALKYMRDVLKAQRGDFLVALERIHKSNEGDHNICSENVRELGKICVELRQPK